MLSSQLNAPGGMSWLNGDDIIIITAIIIILGFSEEVSVPLLATTFMHVLSPRPKEEDKAKQGQGERLHPTATSTWGFPPAWEFRSLGLVGPSLGVGS